jgi:Flp pilus assembly protein TadG
MRPVTGDRRERWERGNAAVEMALLLPVLTLIVFGVIDFSRAFYAYVGVASAAHEAAAYLAEEIASSPTTSVLESVAAVESRVSGASFLTFGATGNSTLTVPAVVAGTTNASYVRVLLTYRFKLLSGILFSGQLPISVSAAAPRPGMVQ